MRPGISSTSSSLPDGTFTGSATISQVGNVYTLEAPFIGAIVDERNGSTFQGQGNTVTTTGALVWGFQVNTTHGVTVNNLVITGEANGFEVLNSTDVIISTSTAGAATGYGFIADYSTGVTFHSDYSNTSADGFAALYSSDVTITDCVANLDGTAFTLDSDSTAILENDEGEHASTNGLYGQLDVGVDLIADIFSSARDDGVYLVVSSSLGTRLGGCRVVRGRLPRGRRLLSQHRRLELQPRDPFRGGDRLFG